MSFLDDLINNPQGWGAYRPTPAEPAPGEASAKSYAPTWRDNIGSWFSDNLGKAPETERVISGLVGSTGLGNNRGSLIDFTPASIPLFAQEAKRHAEEGNYGQASLAALGAIPAPALNGAGKVVGEAADLLGPVIKGADASVLTRAATELSPTNRGAHDLSAYDGLGGDLTEIAGRMVPQGRVDAVLGRIGWKARKEADLKAQIAAADAMPVPEGGFKDVRARGDRAAIDPQIYRKMQDEQGPDAVLKLVQANGHLRPDGKGGYIGAPDNITSPQKLKGMRQKADAEFRNAADTVDLFDPNRAGTWYDRAKAGIQLSSEPWMYNQVLDAHGAYSAGVSPEGELGFALSHHGRRAVGENGMAQRGVPMKTLDDAHGAFKRADLGNKTGEYANKNDPRLPNDGLFGTNDFRHAQFFGNTDPRGAPWTQAVSATMHPFMDAETAGIVGRANRSKMLGRDDWMGPHVQEYPWVAGKAEDLYRRGKNARYAGPEAEGYGRAVVEANNTSADYLFKNAFNATHESIPGKNTGHIPSVLDATPEAKQAYSDAGSWSQRLDPDDPHARDVLYQAAQLRQVPALRSTGAYENSAKEVEHNPVNVTRPLGFFDVGGGEGKLHPEFLKAADAIEHMRGLMDGQEAYAGHMINTGASAGEKTALQIDTRPLGETLTGTQPTAENLGNIAAAINAAGYGDKFGASANGRGVGIIPFGEVTPKDLKSLHQALAPVLAKEFPGAKMLPGTPSSVFGPALSKWGEGGLEATGHNTGEATMSLLEKLAGLSPHLTRNLGEAEGPRRVIQNIMKRDAAYGGEARADLQKTREFFGSDRVDWNKAVELIRKGTAPAAALAALGYSANAMADEKDKK